MSPAGTTSAAAEAPRAARPNTVIAVLAFAGIVVSLMQSVVIPLVPQLPELLDASASDTSWAVTATLLAGAVATPVMGRLGDMYGKRRMLLFSLIVLVIGSVVIATSNSLLPMIIGRTLQGMAAGVIALGISIMRDTVPTERLASATALMSASLGVGGALGLPAAAFLADQADWHVLFWAAAGLAAIVTVLVVALVPESKSLPGGRFDLVGAVGLSIGLLCLMMVISKGADWGWTSPLTMILLAGAAVTFLAWGAWELRVSNPLVDLQTTTRRQVLVTNLASVVFGFAMFAMSLVIPQVVQLPEFTGYGLGMNMFIVGLVMAPSGIVMMAMAPVSARITNTKGPKVTLMVGAVVVAIGYTAGLVLMSSAWQLAIVSALVGTGTGLAYGAMPALIMAAVPVSETAAANSLNTLMRSLGTSTASAIAGAVLANMTSTFGSATLPSLDGLRAIMAIGAGAAVVALICALFLPDRPATATASSKVSQTPAAR